MTDGSKESMLFTWIEEYDFNDLNTAQQADVLEQMSRAEYDVQRQAILQSIVYFGSTTTSVEEQEGTPKTSSWFSRVLNYPVPLYQIAASALVILSIAGIGEFLQKTGQAKPAVAVQSNPLDAEFDAMRKYIFKGVPLYVQQHIPSDTIILQDPISPNR